MLVSKFYRVATSGKTADGREISPEQIDQMAENYNPDTYGARIWMEHYRSIMPDGMFPAFGDVLALKAEDGEDGKRVLLAQIAPSADLIKINRSGQKVYSSIEINPNFSDTNEAYLMGLAVTDSPASIGTEMMQFCMKNREDFKQGSELPNTTITDTIEGPALEFTESETKNDDGEDSSWIKKFKNKLLKKDKKTETAFSEIQDALLDMADAVSELQNFSKGVSSAKDVDALNDQVTELKTKISELEKLSQQPAGDHTKRPPSDGSGDHTQTDC